MVLIFEKIILFSTNKWVKKMLWTKCRLIWQRNHFASSKNNPTFLKQSSLNLTSSYWIRNMWLSYFTYFTKQMGSSGICRSITLIINKVESILGRLWKYLIVHRYLFHHMSLSHTVKCILKTGSCKRSNKHGNHCHLQSPDKFKNTIMFISRAMGLMHI